MKFEVSKTERGIYFEKLQSNSDSIPVVLVMGYAGSSRSWSKEFLQDLSNHKSVVVLDNRGTGQSIKPFEESAYSIEEMTEDLNSVFKSLQVPTIHLVGYSLGGCISYEFAIRNSLSLSSLTLISTKAGGRLYHPPKAGVLDRLANPVGKNLEELNRSTWELCMSSKSVDSHWNILRSTMEEQTDRLTPRCALRGQFNSYKKFDRTEKIKFNFPVTIVSGDSDPLTPKENSFELSQIIEGSKLSIIPNCEHMPHIENRNALLQIILKAIG